MDHSLRGNLRPQEWNGSDQHKEVDPGGRPSTETDQDMYSFKERPDIAWAKE